MKILIVTDAWLPQVSGVVQSLLQTKTILESMGHEVAMVTPDQFFTIPCPTYSEIRLALGVRGPLFRQLRSERFDAIHIATEGPLGLAARDLLLLLRLPFTTAYHTHFPEYIQARFFIPAAFTFYLMRWFHGRSQAVMVSTRRLMIRLLRAGFKNLKLWSRGVDTTLFNPDCARALDALPRPILLYVGRVAIEKNIEEFLRVETSGSKVIVGNGPHLQALRARFPEAHFLGYKRGKELAGVYASADVFVFPSRTDTFGLVMLEALASGVPVAALPVPGPLDVVGRSGPGALDWNLNRAIEKAREIPRARCRSFALQYSWENAARQFLSNLHPISHSTPSGRS